MSYGTFVYKNVRMKIKPHIDGGYAAQAQDHHDSTVLHATDIQDLYRQMKEYIDWEVDKLC